MADPCLPTAPGNLARIATKQEGPLLRCYIPTFATFLRFRQLLFVFTIGGQKSTDLPRL